ncbi:hypothetical protein [Rhizobium grahamii]|nr:hypothetical protein [Rhizobium grahamii]
MRVVRHVHYAFTTPIGDVLLGFQPFQNALELMLTHSRIKTFVFTVFLKD